MAVFFPIQFFCFELGQDHIKACDTKACDTKACNTKAGFIFSLLRMRTSPKRGARLAGQYLLTCKWREARGDSVGEQFLRVLPVTGSPSRTQPPLSQNISPLPPSHDGLTAVSKAPEMPWRVLTQTKSIKGKARRF